MIYFIVEGHGEIEAVPVLARRIFFEKLHIFDQEIAKPHRIPSSRICQFGNDLYNAILLGRGKVVESGNTGGVIILVDSDDDCPVQMQNRFNEFCVERNINFPCAFVAANREFEVWFLCDASSLSGHPRVREDAQDVVDAEFIRGAKGHFERHILLPDATYSETIDQAKFCAAIDLDEVESKSRSFRKLVSTLRFLTD